jgi:hypothetical protein
MPGVQNPHWTAPASTHASCRGCGLSRVPRPSRVVTPFSLDFGAKRMQERTGRPPQGRCKPRIRRTAALLHRFHPQPPKEGKEGFPGLNLHILGLSVELKINFHQTFLSSAFSIARKRARRTKTPATSFRHQPRPADRFPPPPSPHFLFDFSPRASLGRSPTRASSSQGRRSPAWAGRLQPPGPR